MHLPELLSRLKGIEGVDFEVKAAAGGVPDDAYKTVSAFANTAGGWLILGVSERRGQFTITGVTDPDRLQNDLVSATRSAEKFSRPVDLLPRLLDVDGASVLCVRINAAPRYDKPVRVRSRKIWECYVRVGGSDHLCTPEEEARFLRDASLEGYDDQPIPDATVEDLSPRAIRWFRALLAERHPERHDPQADDTTWLTETGLLKGSQPTRAAALLFGRDRLLVHIKPGGMLDLRFIDEPIAEGIPERRWDDRELFEDNLVGTLRGALERLGRALPHPFALDPTTARSMARSPDFPFVREALVNLLVNQDYADRHRTARVLWYQDCAVFENPGDSFVPLDNMLDGGVSKPRNPLLAQLLRQAGFAEQAGSGMLAIVRRWRTARRRPPILQNDPGEKQFTLMLPWDNWTSTPRGLRNLGLDPDEDAGRLLAVLGAQGRLGWVEARLATGLSGAGLSTLISRLVANGQLVPLETGGEPAWRLSGVGDPPPPTSFVFEPATTWGYDGQLAAQRAEQLWALIAVRPGQRVPDLVTATGWSAAMVKRVLADLRGAGRVRFVGSMRTGGYRA